MTAKTSNEKIIFGLKVKQLRQEQGLSFSDLSKASGMSLSYLNEIEKGKKFPKQDKVKNLAKALGTTREELTNGKLGRHLAPVTQLLQSNFLNELPLELFGIELSKVADLIAQAPTRVGAFISTLLELSRSYALREENFYFAALRSYLELHENYFSELEDSVEAFSEKHGLPGFRPVPPRTLGGILESAYGYTIVPEGLNEHPDLQMFRSVYLPEDKRLLLNGNLTAGQRGFQYGKELGFNHLKLTERANTSSLLRSKVFEEVLNHSRATYFSVALHIPLHPFVESVKEFFALPTWDGEAFLGLMRRYNATPEMFYHRLTNVLPKFFGLRELFFLRFLQEADTTDYTIDKELHLSRRHHPHENGLFERYCRRWVSLSLLEEMAAEGSGNMRIDVQRSHYFGTEDEYLCITLARTGHPRKDCNVSLTLGFMVNDKLNETISWLNDPAIQARVVNTTCERCPITDCAERAAEPIVVRKREKYQRIKTALKEL
ncbi:helix-turn-helix domain-containing protein [Neolewinella aurantiaca]|uniref:Helix-turn-helix domain-containing protein n=1 Tax=Neolewinella aurantiaca TaxID=2602767 RepID=A0A5C7FT33_9BACT|nr:helix-turn-helix transcriptional regulator [Neolewinella aurantiaca]TXF88521.1 helix-turn-helix domain-containing protein [Neolewinella aurantiaca]